MQVGRGSHARVAEGRAHACHDAREHEVEVDVLPTARHPLLIQHLAPWTTRGNGSLETRHFLSNVGLARNTLARARAHTHTHTHTSDTNPNVHGGGEERTQNTKPEKDLGFRTPKP